MTALTVDRSDHTAPPTAAALAAAPPVDPGPALRRLPVPVAEPRPALRVVRDPQDVVPAGQTRLPFDLDPPLGGTGVLSAIPGRRRGDDTAVAELCATRPTSATALPDPRRWAGQFVQAAVEVAAGQRPAGQLARWTTEEVYEQIARRGRLTARQERAAGPSRAVVHSVRICQPADSVVEAAAVVSHRSRVRAVALRLEGVDGRWRVTALEIG